MKKVIFIISLLLILLLSDEIVFNETTYNIYNRLVNKNTSYKIIENEDFLISNDYLKKDLSNYVTTTDNLVATSKQDLLDIYYSAINKGYDKLTFYCDKDYYTCGDDIADLNKEEDSFSYTNQLVHVYNSYKSITSSYSSNLRVDIAINKKYTEEDIEKIDNELNNIIIKYHINDYENIRDKIKIFHDYLANNNVYDEEMADNGTSDYNSDSAIGALFEGKAICSGYTDAFSLFLDKLGIENTRVATDEHVWNALRLNDTWYHIDLTWDDPIVDDGSNIIQYDYYMLTTNELLNKNDEDHMFNQEVYNFIY